MNAVRGVIGAKIASEADSKDAISKTAKTQRLMASAPLPHWKAP